VVGLVAVPGSVTMDVVAWLLAIAVPAIAVSFLVGIGRWHLFVTAALRDANARLQRLPSPRDVRDVLAEVFEDRQLQIGCGERSGYPASQIAPYRDGRWAGGDAPGEWVTISPAERVGAAPGD
jgi:hypothetical protein